MLTKDQIRAVRLRDSELVELERLGLKLRVVMMGSAIALQIREMQGKDAGTETKVVPLMLQGGLANENGDLLGEGDVDELLSVLNVDELQMLTTKINAKVRPQKASPTPSASETSSTASASPSAGPTQTS